MPIHHTRRCINTFNMNNMDVGYSLKGYIALTIE
jgi:hypothetical protein